MESQKISIVGKTKSGKEIGYRILEGETLYSVCFTSGGKIPDELGGHWNDLTQLRSAINNYLDKKVKK